MLEEVDNNVDLRNVQRDLYDLAKMHSTHVKLKGKRDRENLYTIDPDMCDKLQLPVEQNALLALFFIKRLQPFFAPHAKSFEDMGEAIVSQSTQQKWDIFDTLDDQLQESLHTFGNKPTMALDTAMLNEMLIALSQKRTLHIMYERDYNEAPQERTIRPVKLILSGNELYFCCISHRRQTRNFFIKLCRIREAHVTDEKFEVSDTAMKKIDERLGRSFGILDNQDDRAYRITLRFPSWYHTLLSEKRLHATQRITQDRDGNVLLHLQVPVGTELVNWVMSWGRDVEVVKPKRLKNEIADIARHWLAQGGVEK
jgi:predicted DNA-binding transcriptional regulator YafY